MVSRALMLAHLERDIAEADPAMLRKLGSELFNLGDWLDQEQPPMADVVQTLRAAVTASLNQIIKEQAS